MRIVHFINSLDPDTGGPPAVAMRMSAAQVGLGHTVSLCGGCPPGREGHIDDFLAQTPGIEKVGLKKFPLDAGGSYKSENGRSVADELDDLHKEAPIDVVHFHGLWRTTVVRAGAWCRKNGVPYIIRPAGMLDFWSMEQGKLKKKIALATTHRSLVRKASAIQALNPHEKTAVERFGFGVRIEVIPNGVFIEEVDRETEPGEFRKTVEGLGDSPYALFLSRLHYKKGLDLLADAWAMVAGEFPEVMLVVAGPRDDDSIDDFNTRIERAGLTDRVFVVGPLYGRTKTSAYREAELFVLPTRQEGFSMAVTEALAMGLPAVITHDCHYPDVTEFDAGVETELSAKACAEGLRKLLGDPAYRKEAGARGAELVHQRYTWPAIGKTCADLYAELAAGGGR